MPPADFPSWLGDLHHLAVLDAAVFAADPAGHILYANETGLHMLSSLVEEVSLSTRLHALLPPDEHGALDEIIGQVLAGTRWTGRLAVLRVEGSPRLAEVSCAPLQREGELVGLVCLVDDTASEQVHAAEVRRLGDRLTKLARVAAELSTAEDIDQVAHILTSEAADAVGATVASLSLLQGADTLALIGIRGGRTGVAQRWGSYSVHAPTPAGDVVRSGKPLVLVGETAINGRYPHLERAASGERSMACLPLCAGPRILGVLTFSFPGRRILDKAELEFLGLLADSCAQALERLRAVDDAAEQAARIRFLADATTELARSLDYQATLSRVAHLAVPDFADWCAIDVLEDERLHRLAVAHVDPAKIELAIDLERRYPADPRDPNGPWEAIRTGQSQLMPEIPDELLVQGARDEEHLRIARALDLRSALVVPLTTRGRVLGVLTWVTAESDRRYAESDLAFAEDLGKRAAIAIDNAQLYSETRQTAVHLQHAILPARMPDLDGWEIAVHYSPAGRTEVGGDFYDAVPLTDGRLAVFVGDVMGRGVEAAAAMAQMRAAVRSYIALDPSPDVVLQHLDRMFATYGLNQLVTLVYLLLGAEHDQLTMVSAGHPPPVLLRPDGTAAQLPTTDGTPLGTVPRPRSTVTVPLPPEHLVLACTDGLIERRGEDIDVGQQRLLQALPELGRGPLQEGLSTVVEKVHDPSRLDDVAAVAVRRGR